MWKLTITGQNAIQLEVINLYYSSSTFVFEGKTTEESVVTCFAKIVAGTKKMDFENVCVSLKQIANEYDLNDEYAFGVFVPKSEMLDIRLAVKSDVLNNFISMAACSKGIAKRVFISITIPGEAEWKIDKAIRVYAFELSARAK